MDLGIVPNECIYASSQTELNHKTMSRSKLKTQKLIRLILKSQTPKGNPVVEWLMSEYKKHNKLTFN